ncbi:MAG: xanthine dehydrogenase molybdopterin binding subunit [Pirellulaceae bacterium]|nr:xanthine dehydrogenase molybdopterin binding subunit [Pirellulaceae bacterium]
MAKAIGRALPHESAVGHVTGTAPYIDDLPALRGELQVDFVGAPCAAGRLNRIDTTEAEKMPGVVAVFTHEDLDGHNLFGPIFQDEPFLVADDISYLGQPVAVIAAETREAARAARDGVVLDVTQSDPVLTIDDAIAVERFIGPKRTIQTGDVDNVFDTAVRTIDGVFHSNGQEQFYFESQAAIALPEEKKRIRVISSTQNPTETQDVVAEALGLPRHQVIGECKRMGGGFGGKETQSAIPAVMVALVTHKTGRSARVIYSKDDDMLITGKRHQYKTWYRAAFDDAGHVLAVEFQFFSNGGAFADLSTAVLERTMLHADNSYYLPNARITGQVCRTNLPPNTAFRGFGGPQGMVVIENVLQEIAQRLGKDAWDIRTLNAYRDGDPNRNRTPYGQIVRDHVIVETFRELAGTSDYRKRMKAVVQFNAESKTEVKGLAMSTVKFGISFTTKFLNQANALVNVYTDGTVQVSTGGTEMGQGLNTKLKQLVADSFGIDPDHVALMSTTTEKNNNASPTAASAGTDLNGTAAINACKQIRKRLKVFAAAHFTDLDRGTDRVLERAPEHIRLQDGHVFDVRTPRERIQFGAFCNMARRERVDLGARGFYAIPGIDFNRETGQGNPFFYYTTGAAVSEVTIDRLTGEMTVDRVDLLMDVGKMINPGVDYGQIIGGFIQGMGWCTSEELVYDPHGKLLSTSPTTYKIPNITDVPKVFRYATIENPKHEINIRRSKAVGEPPLMLAISTWLAAKHAMSFVRADRHRKLRLPATCEENLMCMMAVSQSSPSPSVVQESG